MGDTDTWMSWWSLVLQWRQVVEIRLLVVDLFCLVRCVWCERKPWGKKIGWVKSWGWPFNFVVYLLSGLTVWLDRQNEREATCSQGWNHGVNVWVLLFIRYSVIRTMALQSELSSSEERLKCISGWNINTPGKLGPVPTPNCSWAEPNTLN